MIVGDVNTRLACKIKNWGFCNVDQLSRSRCLSVGLLEARVLSQQPVSQFQLTRFHFDELAWIGDRRGVGKGDIGDAVCPHGYGGQGAKNAPVIPREGRLVAFVRRMSFDQIRASIRGKKSCRRPCRMGDEQCRASQLQ